MKAELQSAEEFLAAWSERIKAKIDAHNYRIIATGKTFDHRHTLYRLGFRWNAVQKCWQTPDGEFKPHDLNITRASQLVGVTLRLEIL